MTTINHENDNDSVPFYPEHVKTEFYVVLGIIGLAILIGVVGLFFPVGLQEPANPLDTPLHVKPEWYFLALYQLLKYIPPQVLGIDGTLFGVTSIIIALLVVVIWPFLDTRPDTKKAVRLRSLVTVIGLIIAIALTIWGEVS